MLYLIIAIAFGSLFAILFKVFQQRGVDALQAIGVNYAVALLLGLAGNVALGRAEAVSAWFVPALFVGLFMMGGFVTMSSATRSHGVAVATIAARVSFVVPVLCAYLFLRGDEPRWIASALVIASLCLIFSHRGRATGGGLQWLFPLLVFLCYGLANFMLKLCQQLVAQAGGGDADLSLLSSVAFAAALVYTIIYYCVQPRAQRRSLQWRNVWAGAVLGIVNTGCTYFLLKALMVIDSGVFYPVYNIAIVTIATLVGRLCFGERLSWWQYAGIAVAILAILLFFV